MMARSPTYNKMRGITIVQTMLILMAIGIAGSLLVNYIIDKRCEADPSREICTSRK